MNKARWSQCVLCISLLLPAWAALADAKQAKAGPPACEQVTQEDKTQLEMIGRVLAEGKAYAALAFLDAAKIDSPPAKLYRAHALRQTGQFQPASELYHQLTSTCMSGLAYQGLGLLAEMQEQHEAATSYLRSASNLLPVDSRVRGDYGYALMRFGDTQTALSELLTAIELDGNNRLAIHNLIMLMYKMGQDEKASQIARDFNISDASLQSIRDESGMPAFKDSQRQQFSLGGCYGNTQICTGILSPRLEVVQ
ncbi:hypothetical protein LG201_04585 [Methylobacillus gramineus]|uniref:tetratricopeptide repeat protein n=1 Tax=Methylobacillus gramineus TaxID=755169 RepID=UPI001CFF8861|nr:hypothetical protein [Methylobacillus gramineus]MCB5184474.1 hypothetical protein [Methylobacillus gramineus]